MAGVETQTCLRGASLQTGILKTQKERQKGECINVKSLFFFSSSLVDGCCCGCLFCLILSFSALPRCTSPVLPCPGVFSLMDCFCMSLCSFFFVFPLLFFRILFLTDVTHLHPLILSFVRCSCSLYCFSLSLPLHP